METAGWRHSGNPVKVSCIVMVRCVCKPFIASDYITSPTRDTLPWVPRGLILPEDPVTGTQKWLNNMRPNVVNAVRGELSFPAWDHPNAAEIGADELEHINSFKVQALFRDW